MSSINRILRNRAAERAAQEFARAAGYGLYPPPHPYGGFGWPPTHMWAPNAATNMHGITPPGSTSSHALSPGSGGSHETPGSPDGNRLIGECAMKEGLESFVWQHCRRWPTTIIAIDISTRRHSRSNPDSIVLLVLIRQQTLRETTRRMTTTAWTERRPSSDATAPPSTQNSWTSWRRSSTSPTIPVSAPGNGWPLARHSAKHEFRWVSDHSSLPLSVSICTRSVH